MSQPNEYYGDEVPELLQNLWACCEMHLDPNQFAAFWTTGTLPPAFAASDRTEQFQSVRTKFRLAIEEVYQAAVNRTPTEEEWKAMFNPADYLFTLPDGGTLLRESAQAFFLELYDACDRELSYEQLLPLATDGLTPDNTADLPPGLIEAFTERLELMTALITKARNAPPTPADWLALHELGQTYR